MLFRNDKLKVSIMVHGDDFVAVGPLKNLDTTKEVLENKYKIKVGVLDRRNGQQEEVRILNKLIRVVDDGIELEADPRHVELAIRDLELESARASTVPGSKDSRKRRTHDSDDGDDDGDESQDGNIIKKKRKSPKSDVMTIENARKSAGDQEVRIDMGQECLGC